MTRFTPDERIRLSFAPSNVKSSYRERGESKYRRASSHESPVECEKTQ